MVSPRAIELIRDPLVIAVTAARFLAALYIFFDPFWGLLWSVFLDIVDARVLLHVVGLSRDEYHMWDKNVDWLAYLVELWVSVQYGVFLPMFLLLFIRFFGQFMFVRSRKVIYFILFPNFYEVAFFWVILVKPIPFRIDTLLIVLFGAKILHEIFMHIIWPRYLLPIWEKYFPPMHTSDA